MCVLVEMRRIELLSETALPQISTGVVSHLDSRMKRREAGSTMPVVSQYLPARETVRRQWAALTRSRGAHILDTACLRNERPEGRRRLRSGSLECKIFVCV